MENNPLSDPFAHSMDSDQFHFPGHTVFDIHEWSSELLGGALSFLGINGLTKFMMLELAAFVILLVVLVPFAISMHRNGYARGVLFNFIETVLLFIRDNIAIPAIGEHHAKQFLPYLWSVFFFVLTNNLLGMGPYLGSPTGALGCTVALALCSFLVIHISGIRELGPAGYAKALVPEVPLAMYPLMLFVEIFGHLIKPTVLAVRLFINMLAGHTVLYIILAFIAVAADSAAVYLVAPASVVGVTIFSLLELFVAFLQAYVFTFLSAIFIGAAVHPHH